MSQETSHHSPLALSCLYFSRFDPKKKVGSQLESQDHISFWAKYHQRSLAHVKQVGLVLSTSKTGRRNVSYLSRIYFRNGSMLVCVDGVLQGLRGRKNIHQMKQSAGAIHKISTTTPARAMRMAILDIICVV